MTSLAQNLAFYRVSADDDVGVDENHHDEHQLNNNPPVASLDTTQNDEDVSDHDENDEDGAPGEEYGDVTPDQIPTVKEMKIKFDIIDTKLIEDGHSKYTVYVILVMQTSRLDADQAVIERRYSEFDQLHQGLRKECPDLMKRIPFPRKKLFSKKFKGLIIEDRSRTFEKYLRCIYHLNGVPETKAFQNFFFRPHLLQATRFLKSEDHQNSFEEYRLALELQKKLGCSNNEMRIIAMCGIVETSKKMEDYERAEQVGEECLNRMLYDVTDPFLLGLMQSVIDAKKRLSKPTESMKRKMKECLKKCSYEEGSIQSLKVLLVKKF